MNQDLSQTFLAITRNSTDLEWLQGALAPLGQVVGADGSLDELLALVDVTFANLVFVGLDREHVVAQAALIEGALEAKPMLAIVALGDGMDNQLVLNAMRAGARDFVAYGSRSSEVAGLVRRLSKRLPAVTPNTQLGGLTVLYGAQGDGDGALLASHLALVVQKSGQQTLLLDLGLPRGDSLALLGLESSFHFGDALRHLRRLDATLIDSAFTSAEAGLRILAYASHDAPLEHTSAAELYMLLSALRQHFQHIVVNLVGQPDSEALRTFVSHCDKLLWCTDQNVLDCRRNLAVLNHWREKGMKLEHARLLVDRYLRTVAPDSETLGKTFGLEVIAVLAYSPEVRLNAKNQGVTLFELAPREALTQSLRTLGERLAKRSQGLPKPKAGWLNRIMGGQMSGEKLFGAPPRAGAGNSDHEGLKLVLHRYIIDAIEESGKNLLESSRQNLSQFVTDKVAEYIARMHLAISRYEMERLAEEIVDELTGFGPLEVLLRDQAVTEILVNGPHRVFVEREGVLHQSDLRFIDAHHVERVMQRILAPLGRRLDESSPMVDARLPDGSRVNAIIPPIALDGPCLSIRKFRKDMLKSSDLIAMQTIDLAIFEFIQEAVGKRCNILISGGTGTGKTTLLNILSQLINPHERLVTIEDVAELQLGHPHVVRLETRPPNAEGHGEVKASDLIRNALRMRPDRIILGEIRGVEVLDVLTAMNTGHDGSMSTVHANNAQDALLRLETLVGLTGRQIAERTLRQMICAALDVVIQLTRMPDGRRCVSEVVEVVGIRDDIYVTNTLFRLDRRTGFGFLREAMNPAGDKLRRESGLGVN